MEKCQDRCSVLIADDHDIVCTGVKFLLQEQPIFDVIDQALNHDALMQCLNQKKYQLLILDLNLGNHHTMHDIRYLSEQFPLMKILVLSMYPEDPYAMQCIHEGASGYVMKTHVQHELIPAIEAVMDNRIYISSKYRETLSYGMELLKKEKPSLSTLSPREFEIYSMIVSGISFKEIASTLNISAKTVSAHHTHILQKLSLSSTAQLIHFSLQQTKNP